MYHNLILGLRDVKIVSFSELNGKLEALLEKDSSSAICPHCHSPSTSIKERKCYSIINKPIDSIPTKLTIPKKEFFSAIIPLAQLKALQKKYQGFLKNPPIPKILKIFWVNFTEIWTILLLKGILPASINLTFP